MAYYSHDVKDYGEQWFEVFYATEGDCAEWNLSENLVQGYDDEYTPGYYYAYGLPGYLHDSELFGPYSSEEDARLAAIEQLEY